MNKEKVYISYDYENERHYKNLLLAWSDFNSLFDDFEIIGTNAENYDQFKRIVPDKMKQATKFLVIIGKYTHKNKWVNWEIEKAKELNIPIIAVKTERENVTPSELYSIGASWAMAFSPDAIINAIKK